MSEQSNPTVGNMPKIAPITDATPTSSRHALAVVRVELLRNEIEKLKRHVEYYKQMLEECEIVCDPPPPDEDKERDTK